MNPDKLIELKKQIDEFFERAMAGDGLLLMDFRKLMTMRFVMHMDNRSDFVILGKLIRCIVSTCNGVTDSEICYLAIMDNFEILQKKIENKKTRQKRVIRNNFREAVALESARLGPGEEASRLDFVAVEKN